MNRATWTAATAAALGMLVATVTWTASGGSGASTTPIAHAQHPGGDQRVVSTPLPAMIHRGDASAASSSARAPTVDESANKELFTYSTTETPHRDGPYTLYPIDVNVDQALASALNGHLELTAPDGSRLSLDYDRHVAHEDGNWTWVGRESGGDAARDAVITFGPDATFGVLPSSNGQRLRLTTVNGHTYMASAPLSQLTQGIRAGGDTVVMGADSSASTSSNSAPVTAAAASSSASPVDVVIGYTSGYRVYRGSASAVTTALTNLVDVANRALSNSQITANGFRLVGTVEVDYPDNTDNSNALTDLASTSSSSPLAAMRAARAQYGADLVSLMRRYSSGQNGCGLAYIPQAPYASTGRDQTFSVVGDGTIDMGGGSYSYCPDTSLAHEMGHNLGAQHNKQTNSTGGLYSYSYGYRNDTAQYYDLMSYGQSGQEAELLYSNPAVSTCKGMPCGVANDADVARTLRETLATAMSFRSAVVPLATSNLPGQIMLANGSNRCLDGAGGGTNNGTAIQMWACNGLRQQQWGEVANTAALQNKDISLVLDAVGYGMQNGTALQLWSSAGSSNQAWMFTHTAIVTSAGRVLDAVGFGTGNGTRIQLWDDNSSQNQRFSFNPTTGQIVSDTGRCLDVAGYGTANGTPVQLWDCNQTDNQKFKIGPNGSLIGYGGNCLEAANGGTGNGTEIRMWQCNAQPHQKWRLRGEIRGSQSGLCLDDPAGGTQNGARTQLFACQGNDHQKWEYQPN